MHRIIFQFGSFTLYSYGLLVAAGFLLSTILILRDSEKFGMRSDSIFDCLIVILIGGLIGGRLLFVLINWEYYCRYPLRALMFYEGGLAFQGALAVAVLSGAVMSRIKKLSFWKASDLIAPYIALGQAVGRIGCYLNGCCYGRVIERGIGVTFPGETVMRIPTQTYSSLFLLMIFMVLIALRKRRLFDGYLFTMYMILYASFRFFMDFMRGDNLAVFLGIRISQIISIGMFLCGIIVYIVLSRAKKRGNEN
ncbi:MAG: prolipoprotein diacylglyceryl transferase [Candidatus Makaraimicrobium thalassicum]|nr:MAG: prolipoprotein diacylglyceryl transferase [Candidatus Omnitrophota bacterium]